MFNLKQYLLQKMEKSYEIKYQMEEQLVNVSEWSNIRPEVKFK